jgi:hypothetical protein
VKGSLGGLGNGLQCDFEAKLDELGNEALGSEFWGTLRGSASILTGSGKYKGIDGNRLPG